MPAGKLYKSGVKYTNRTRILRVKRKRKPYRKRIGYPRRKLKLSYRAINAYKFVRETEPQIITPTVITGTGTQANIGYFQFKDLKIDDLPNWAEFENLFARFKVTCIVTTLIPMAQGTLGLSDMSALALATSANSKVTRVNTKWLNKEFEVASTAEDQLHELAQIQSKSVSLYMRKYPLKIVTKLPGLSTITLADPEVDPALSSNQIVTRSPGKWLNCEDASQVKFSHNNILFMEKLDGSDINSGANYGRYYMTHKIYFSVAQVG